MKHIRKSCTAFLLALLVIAGIRPASAYADSTIVVEVPVTYGQTEARSMLDMINAFRASDDAWYWDSTNSVQIKYEGLSPLSYDYNLEQIAMQRAVEIALRMVHERPDGSSWQTTTASNGARSQGENIAAGYPTVEAAFNIWQENDKLYEGQGHRRNMLSDKYTAIGIGHVVYNGRHYWTQEFGISLSSSEPTAANDSAAEVPVAVSAAVMSDSSVTLDGSSSYTLPFDGTMAAPKAALTVTMEDVWPVGARFTSSVTPVWVSDDPSVISVSNGLFHALKVGRTNLAADVLGKSLSVTVTVEALTLAGAEVTVPESLEFSTDGPLTPEPTVVLNGKTLVKDVDYSVEYTGNDRLGMATVKVVGRGNYIGTATAEFAIVECIHEFESWQTDKESTCLETGTESSLCTKCGRQVTRELALKPHSPVTDEAVEPTCTEDGKTVGSHCPVCGAVLTAQETVPAKGHSWDRTTVKEASCTEEGLVHLTCATCREETDETVEKTAHTPVIDQAAVEPSCTTEGKTESSRCSVCKEVLSTSKTIPAKGHDWDNGVLSGTVRTFTCSTCGEKKTSAEYHITKGAMSAWTKGSSEGLTITSDGDFSKFDSVLVDNAVLDGKYYEAKSGSTVVTLKASYLETLSPGTHSFVIRFNDGYVGTSFDIKAKSNVPKTGDENSIVLPVALMLASAVGVGTCVYIWLRKKKK